MISAIVLAAGKSRRMGVQKLLLPLGEKPVLAVIVDEVLTSPVDEVLVIVGDDGQRIAQALSGRPVKFVVNPEPEGDMLSSVRCGLTAVSQSCRSVLVVLGDQPGIDRCVIAGLIQASYDRGRGIAVPTFDGKRGHPVLVSTKYREEILHQHDTVGLRGLLLAHPHDVHELPAPTPAVLEDIDYPDDYRRVMSRFVDPTSTEGTRP